MSKTIFLEFQHASGALAAGGSDTIMYLDGRWSAFTTRLMILRRVAQLRKRSEELYPGPRRRGYGNRLFVGYTVSHSSGGSDRLIPMIDPNPPEWKVQQDHAKALDEEARRNGNENV